MIIAEENEQIKLAKLRSEQTVSSLWETRVIQAVETLSGQGLVAIDFYTKQIRDLEHKLNTKIYKFERGYSSSDIEKQKSETWKRGCYTPGIEPNWKS